MAYSTANRPALINVPVAGGFNAGSTNTMGNLWSYKSSDPMSTVQGSSYFSEGYKIGMRVSDIVFVTDTTNTKLSIGQISAVTTQASGSQGGAGATLGTLLSTGS